MHFTIITDHNVLKALKTKADLEGRLMCWAEYLMEYDFDIIHKAGKKNVVPDFLSRNLVNLNIDSFKYNKKRKLLQQLKELKYSYLRRIDSLWW